MIIHDFYKLNSLRVHEIPCGLKNPVALGWPGSSRPYDEVEAAIDGMRYDKYGWILDDEHLVIDIDLHNPQENGFDALAKLDLETGIPLDTVCKAIVNTPSGGRHYYFRKPPNVTLKRTSKAKYPGIDFIACKGKQVVAANSPHDKYPGVYEINDDAELVDIPDLILDTLLELSDTNQPAALVNYVYQDRSGDEFNNSERGLQCMINALASSGYQVRRHEDHYEFDRPGKSTSSKCSGYLGKKSKQGNYQLTSFSLSDPVFPSGESISIFHAYSMLCHAGDHKAAAMRLYDMGFAKSNEVEVDLSFLFKEIPADDEVIPDEEFCESMVPQSGILRMAFDFYRESAFRSSNVMGLAVAISVCETIFGRRIRSHTDIRTNDYNVVLAPTGSGKEACETAVSKILLHADPGGSSMYPSKMSSGNAIEKVMSTNPCGVWVCDEFGKVLQAVLDRKGHYHLKEVGNNLLKLYGKSSGIWTGSAHADGVRNQINQPHLVILGLATPSTVFNCVSSEQLNDGLIGRIAFWVVQDRPEPKEEMEIVDPSELLIESVRQWLQFKPGGNLGSENPVPITVYMSDPAKMRWKSHGSQIDVRMRKEPESRAAIWARVAARSMKLALVHRAARLETDPTHTDWEACRVELEDVNWGIKVANYLARTAVSLVSDDVPDPGLARAVAILAKAVESGPVSGNALHAAHKKISASEFAAAADKLGLLVRREKTKGRPKVFYEKPMI